MEQIINKERHIVTAGVDSEGVVYYKEAGIWKCRKCGGEFRSLLNPPKICSQCNRVCMFDSVSPPIIDELWRPYGEPVPFGDINILYESIFEFVEDHLVMDDDNEKKIMVLWIIASYKQHVFSTAPYLQFQGEIESGKTRALEVLGMLGYRAINLITISPSALCRVIERFSPTVLLDQAEKKFDQKTERGCELYDVFMSGYKKGQRYIVADRNSDTEIISRDVFGFKAVASTRSFDAAFDSRSFVFHMRQGYPKVKRVTAESLSRAEELRNMLLYYHLKQDGVGSVEVELGGRRGELFDPLLAVGADFGVVYDDIKEYMVEDQEVLGETMADTLEADILREIKIWYHGIEETERITIMDLASHLNMEPRAVGYRLKNMNIKRKHGREGAFIDLTDEATQKELQYLFKKYRIGG